MKHYQGLNRMRGSIGAICVVVGAAMGASAAVPTAFLADQTGDTWGYVISDSSATIVERSWAESEIRLASGCYYRRELKIPSVVDSHPVVSVELEHGALVDCMQERCSFLTIPGSITNITGRLDRNDPNCYHRARGEMFSVEGLRFLGDVPRFPSLDLQQSDTFPFSTASKIYVLREFASAWSAFLSQLGMTIAGYVEEDTDCIGVTMRSKIGERVLTYRFCNDTAVTLCRWNEASDALSDIVGVMHRTGTWTDAYGSSREYGIWSEAACMPMTNATLSIPAMIDGRTVVALDGGSFYNGAWDGCAAFTDLTIPDTVTNIGEYAFFNYTNIQRLVIGSGVSAVGQAAFDQIEEYQDEGDWQVRQIRGLAELRELVLGSPEVVAAFCIDTYDNDLMREVRTTYPNVTNVVLNGRFTALPERYFLGRFPSLQTVTLPEGIDNIPAGAFDGCGALTELTIPDTVTNIGMYAFFGCTNLQRLVIGSGVVSAPKHEPILGYWDAVNEREVFGCDSLRELVLGSPEVVAAFCIDTYDNDLMREVRTTYPNVTNVILNGRFTALPERHFLGRFPSLQTVTLPEGIDNIPAGAFDGCGALTELTIPDTVTNIGMYAFFGCTNLQRLVIGSGVVSVPEYGPVFGYWDEVNQREIGGLPSLSFVEIRSELGIRALIPDYFEGNYPSVTDMVIAETITLVPVKFFEYFPNLENLQAAPGVGPVTESDGRSYVNGYWWNYRVAGGWVEIFEVESPYGDVCVPDEINGKPVVSLTSYALSGARNITLGKNVRYVNSHAFGTPGTNGAKVSVTAGNEYLVVTNGLLCDAAVTHVYFCEDDVVNLVIPKTIRSFDLDVCFQHANLKSVVFPEGMPCIDGTQVFMHSGLESITFASTMTSLGETAFDWCDHLKHVALPTSLRFVNPQSFCNSGLRDVDIPDLVTNIGYNAFCNCYDLTNVAFGASVSEVGISAFRSCTNLVQISFRGNAPTIRPSAFANVPKTCKVFVEKGSTGWGTGIPGVWNGMSIYWAGENPSEASIPFLGEAPDMDAVKEALSDVDDANVRSNIDDSNYVDFRNWAGKVKTKGEVTAAGFSAVQSSPNAWLSYAIASDTLIDKTPTNGQMRVEAFESTSTAGSFDFTVSIDDIAVGSDATKENLKKVFGLEGGTSIEEMSPANVDITFGTPVDGKVKFTAGPNAKNAEAKTFFMKVKMTP